VPSDPAGAQNSVISQEPEEKGACEAWEAPHRNAPHVGATSINMAAAVPVIPRAMETSATTKRFVTRSRRWITFSSPVWRYLISNSPRASPP